MSIPFIISTHAKAMSATARTLSILLLAASCAAALLPAGALAQAKKPISKKGLLTAIKINGLTTREFVREIETRGVDFEMSSADEAEIRSAGARPEIIEAARLNYRAPRTRPSVPAANSNISRPAATRPSASIPAGPPLSKSEVVTMLQGGIAPARVEQFVEVRGVSFSITPDVAREITAAGGTRSLIGAITERAVASSSNDDDDDYDAAAEERSPSYDGLIDQAQASFDQAVAYNDANGMRNAVGYLEQAIKMDPSQAKGFQLLGRWLLLAGDFTRAEQAMRAAIERGGSASFRVAHDHDGSFNQYCEGSFFVSKSGLSFVANDGRDTFEVEDANVKEFKTNRLVGANVGAFHVKPVQKINGRDNFNFAPLSTNKAESALIIRMFQAF